MKKLYIIYNSKIRIMKQKFNSFWDEKLRDSKLITYTSKKLYYFII
jgi:hypothetical protein